MALWPVLLVAGHYLLPPDHSCLPAGRLCLNQVSEASLGSARTKEPMLEKASPRLSSVQLLRLLCHESYDRRSGQGQGCAGISWNQLEPAPECQLPVRAPLGI